MLNDILFVKNLKILDKKHYLLNIKYYNINYNLYPYYNIYYYFKKQAITKKNSIKKEKLFNFIYSSFSNIAKRIFGVTK